MDKTFWSPPEEGLELSPTYLPVVVLVHFLKQLLHGIAGAILLTDLLRQPKELCNILITAECLYELPLVQMTIFVCIATIKNITEASLLWSVADSHFDSDEGFRAPSSRKPENAFEAEWIELLAG